MDNVEDKYQLIAKKIKFRNYIPHDATLLKLLEIDQKEKSVEITPSELLKREIEAAIEEQQNEEDGTIAPKKPNWDLKNQVAGRMTKLQRRTQRAIVDILREKMAQEDENGTVQVE